MLHRLDELPAQHHLLILRYSIQLKFRHLLRTLPYQRDLYTVWQKWDKALRASCLKLRGQHPTEDALDQHLLSLPVKYGGMGIAPHALIAPGARAASEDQSDRTIAVLLGQPTTPTGAKTQRQHCEVIYQHMVEQLVSKLSPQQLLQFADNHGRLAAQWLSAIPQSNYSSLSSEEVAVGICYRTLLQGHNAVCRYCAQPNKLGHDELCKHRERFLVERHEYVKKIIAYTMRQIPGNTVTTEPSVRNQDRHSLRTDLRITGSTSYQAASSEYDVKIISVHARMHHQPASATEEDSSPLTVATSKIRSTKYRRKGKKLRSMQILSAVYSTHLYSPSGVVHHPRILVRC